MISKAEIKKIRALDTKKGRDSHQLILIEGKRLVEQIISTNCSINKIWATEDFKNKNSNLIRAIELKKIPFNFITKQDLKKITATQNPSGIVGVMSIPKGDIKGMNQRIIILDNISDPGNLGTILRTANWFGVCNILLSKECVDPYNTKVIRSAMGAHFSMNIVIDKIDSHIKQLQSENFKIIAADLDTQSTIKNLKINTDKWALLMGSEAHGLSEAVSKLVDCKIKIPQVGEIESLNVSVACGIFLYHISAIN